MVKTVLFACIAALGGLLFGYHSSVISGVLLFASKEFHFSIFDQELIVSTLIFGALIGALTGGMIADRLGRKKALFATCILFFLGTITLMMAGSLILFLLGRLVVGLAIGMIVVAANLYIAEISPAKHRGTLVSLTQFGITIGILAAFLVAYFMSKEGDWKGMLGFAFIPIAIQFFGLFFIKESPFWQKSRAESKPKKAFRISPPFWIGIGIASFQTLTGINTVIYYAPQLFQHVGYADIKSALFASVLVGSINVLGTILALWLIDILGRRTLLITGLVGMSVSLVLIATSLSDLIAPLAYVFFFAISLGPIAWLLIAEIFPLEVRGRSMGIATFSNWFCNYFVSLTFLTLLTQFGVMPTFLLYTFICLLALWFVIKLVPETKGKTLEQIQEFWKK